MAKSEEKVRDLTLALLLSSAAAKVEFTFNGVYFSGAYFHLVATSIREKVKGNRGIGFREGHVDPDADANYSAVDDVYDLPTFDYGRTANQRDTLIHESFHAWRDLMGQKVDSASGPVTTTALQDEAMAYIVGSLFTIYDTTPKGKKPRPPYWTPQSRVFQESYDIAESIMNKSRPVVPPSDAAVLRSAILADPTYSAIKDNPDAMYGNNGV